MAECKMPNGTPLEEFVAVPLSTIAFAVSELRTYRAHLAKLNLTQCLALLDENIMQLEQCVAAAIAAVTAAVLDDNPAGESRLHDKSLSPIPGGQ